MDFAVADEEVLRPASSRDHHHHQHRCFDDFHFIEGTPAQFLNQQLTTTMASAASDPFALSAAPPPGLVGPEVWGGCTVGCGSGPEDPDFEL